VNECRMCARQRIAVTALLCSLAYVQNVDSQNLILPDYFGRKSGFCCKASSSEACRATLLGQCKQALCDCPTVNPDFPVAGLGSTQQNGESEGEEKESRWGRVC